MLLEQVPLPIIQRSELATQAVELSWLHGVGTEPHVPETGHETHVELDALYWHAGLALQVVGE